MYNFTRTVVHFCGVTIKLRVLSNTIKNGLNIVPEMESATLSGQVVFYPYFEVFINDCDLKF